MDKLIYDRTQEDIANKTSKGYYNATDLNRVESWCRYLADSLTAHGYPISITTKTNWTINDFPTYSEMARIRSNIITIMQGYASMSQMHDVSSLDSWNFEDANNWEKILYEIDTMMLGMENNYIISGVSRVGQPRIWQQRFRRKHKYYEFHTWEDLDEEYWNDFDENQTWIGVEFLNAKNNE